MTDSRYRIAVLLGQADEEFQRRFLSGFAGEAKALDLDVFVFSMHTEYQNTGLRETGDSSIFKVVNFKLFDGVVVLGDTMQTSGLAERVEERIKDEFEGAVLFIDCESRYFRQIWTDGRSPMKALTDYLVQDCGYRDFAFLNGKSWHRHSIERYNAFREALNDNGIIFDEEKLFDGDFWYTSGNACAKKLLTMESSLPDVVVCANDMMAIGICSELESKGIRVPEDIAVAGFDSSHEGRKSPKVLTSAYLASVECGKFAAGSILKLIKDEIPDESYKVTPELVKGETCIPLNERERVAENIDRRDEWDTAESDMSYLSVHNTFNMDVLGVDTLSGLSETIFDYVSQDKKVKTFDLFLNSQWISSEIYNENVFKDGSLSDTVIHAIKYSTEEDSFSGIDLSDRLESQKILPDLDLPGASPRMVYLSPLFFDDRFFGYTAVRFAGDGDSYDIEYRMWLRAISNALEVLTRTIRLGRTDSNTDPAVSKTTANSNSVIKVSELLQDEMKELKEVEKILDDNLFNYYFQPVVSASTGEIYSYEALMRANSALQINPLKIIRYAGMLGRLDDIERLTFLNVLDIVDRDPVFEHKKVFINSIPGTRLSAVDTGKIEKLLSKHSSNVVVEFTEQAELDDKELSELKEKYMRLGAGIALDDYGTGYSNVSNLLRYMPNIVKIDRSLLSDIDKSIQKQHFVREIIEFCHENGIKALAEGVETSEELRVVIGFGVDLLQGYYTGRPSPDIVREISEEIRLEIIRYQQERRDGENRSVYVAGMTNRVLMSNLNKDNVSAVIIGQGRMTYRDITFVGIPGQKTDIRMEIESGYEGTVVLDNVSLSSTRKKPCISIPSGGNVTLVLNGENFLKGGGILVSEGARLRIEGTGSLNIKIDAEEYFGIGAGISERHGQIDFSQRGEINIDATGRSGVCIGSGLGGTLNIYHGRYRMTLTGKYGVGIGCFEGASDMKLHGCDILCDATLSDCVCCGSVKGNTVLDIERSLIKCYVTAKNMSALGTINGQKCDLRVFDANIRMDYKADISTGIGALEGTTDVSVDHGGIRIIADGEKALAFGGGSEDTDLNFDNADIRVDIRTGLNTDTYAKSERIKIVGGRSRFYINGKELTRKTKMTSSVKDA